MEPEERPRLTRSLSDRGPNSVLEPLSVVRAASMPVVAEQVEVFEDRARGLLPDSQTATEAEAMLRSPPPLRRSARVSLPSVSIRALPEKNLASSSIFLVGNFSSIICNTICTPYSKVRSGPVNFFFLKPVDLFQIGKFFTMCSFYPFCERNTLVYVYFNYVRSSWDVKRPFICTSQYSSK